MAKKIIYESKLFPGVVFNSYDEAFKAEEGLKNRRSVSEAYEAIGKFSAGASAMVAAKNAGTDAWATAPREDLQRISEGQILNEMYKNPIGLARGYGLSSNTSEPAKTFMSNLKSETKDSERLGGGMLSTYYNQRKKDFEGYVNIKYPELSDEEKQAKVVELIMSPSGSYRHSETGMSGEEEYRKRSKMATLTPDVVSAEASRAATVSAASARAAQEAKTLGLKPPEQKDDQFLMSTRSAYDDIAYARQKFKPEFATPYIGKLIKISRLKQLNPEFADFVSSIEKGISTYRRENFGTAQTGSELQNIKDIVDKDLSVKPEVFLAQIDKFLSTAKRDYNDRIKYMRGQNRLIPEGYEEIGIKGGIADSVNKDQFGFTVGEKKFSKKYGRELEYMGNNQWR
ncbi:MAG: hypothetical protein JXB48_21160 [Candidatus Latescibacteria bacterium]|nr:hypothetical protein [Candidatus Latescibacterota bacterium]